MTTENDLVQAMRKARAEERSEETWRTLKMLGFALLAAVVLLVVGGVLLSRFA
jgi:hypothetical protein